MNPLKAGAACQAGIRHREARPASLKKKRHELLHLSSLQIFEWNLPVTQVQQYQSPDLLHINPSISIKHQVISTAP
jgi:hypothetical protein